VIELLLIRHAKAVPHQAGLDDFDRPLSERGRGDADAMARWIAARAPRPERLFCSTARRTRETAEPLVRVWALAPDAVRYEPSAYAADPERLLELLRYESDGCRVLCLVGHNDGISQLGHRLSGGLEDDLPTCGVAHLQADLNDASALDDRSCRVAGFHTPRRSLPRE
jgi:phosphohistidine phosphatase